MVVLYGCFLSLHRRIEDPNLTNQFTILLFATRVVEATPGRYVLHSIVGMRSEDLLSSLTHK